MPPTRRILAHHDERGVYVYQAFHPETVAVAVEKGTFGKGFSLDRMTWIKPSFGWMLYRSGYATKYRQEAIARIHLSHEGFRAILAQAIPTMFNSHLFADTFAWRRALDKSDVHYQWDPDRDLRLVRLEHRAIQLGIRGETVHRYVNEWILGIEDVTALAHALRDNQPLPPNILTETEYPLDESLQRILGYD